MGQVTRENLQDIFTYHAPNGDQIKKYQALRRDAMIFTNAVLEICPECADRSAAIRKIREALHIANASIALNGQI